jgi:hypothetical protein
LEEHHAHGAVQSDFLAGVYSEWALEVGRELEVLQDKGSLHRDLN